MLPRADSFSSIAPTPASASASAFPTASASGPPLVAKDDLTLVAARRAAEHTQGIDVEKPRLVWFTLVTPLDAKHVATLLGLRGDLYIVSGDVHQRSWRLVIGAGKVADPHNQRIATEMPSVGSWRIDIRIEDRPDGPLPKLVAGASPAYPVAKGTGRVTGIRLTK